MLRLAACGQEVYAEFLSGGCDLMAEGAVSSVLADLEDDPIGPGEHVVQFYERDETLALAVASFLGAGLAAGEKALVVATPPHRATFDAVLVAAGIDVAGAIATGQYISLDAAGVLATFLIDGAPDADRFDASVGTTVSELAASGAPVRIYGEMVALLWDRGAVSAALTLEELWNDLAGRRPFTLFCAYPAHSLDGSASHHAICTRHSAVVPEPALNSAGTIEVSRRFEPTPTAARAARRFVTEALESWGRHDLVDATELVVGELVGNAVRHGGRRFRVNAFRGPDSVLVTVADLSTQLPALQSEPAAAHATSGRGMHLIATVATRWGTQLHDNGKTVWAEIAAEPSSRSR